MLLCLIEAENLVRKGVLVVINKDGTLILSQCTSHVTHTHTFITLQLMSYRLLSSLNLCQAGLHLILDFLIHLQFIDFGEECT